MSEEQIFMDEQARIFIIGTGRTGSHLLGRILGSHRAIRVYMEPQPVFTLVTEVALRPSLKEDRLPRIYEEYDRLCSRTHPTHCAFKTHPCIWIAEELAGRYENSFFIGLNRDVRATVASMMRHPGVRGWCENWHAYEVPNPFLGVTDARIDWYRQASILERCVARWVSHSSELRRLVHTLERPFLNVRYEALVEDPEATLCRLRQFLGLDGDFPPITLDRKPLSKWRTQFSPRDLAEMDSALAFLAQSIHGEAVPLEQNGSV